MTLRKLKTVKTLLFILIAALLALSFIKLAFPQSSSDTQVSVNPEVVNTFPGETIAVNITIFNVQNLYGLDVSLLWNPSALSIQNIDVHLGVESHPDGVLHETPSAEIFVQDNTANQENGEYHLAATSVAPAPSFSGSGNIATLTFTVTGTGQSEFILMTELADYNPSGSTLIDHTDVNGTINSENPEFPPPSPATLIVAAVTIALIGIGLLVYFKKRKIHRAQK